ncbi:serine/threonine-protein kinase PDIK1L-like [Oculina patagonica]
MQQAAVNLPSRVSVGNKTVRILRRLGNGAFGVVYKVKDEESSTDYALKDVLCLNASALRNAIREATTLNKIFHENVIAIMGADQFRDTQGVHMLLLTKYCSGGSLNERLARPSSGEMNLKWISQIAAALAHLHSRGVVHRDLKADNVLLTATEDAKLADFGLAREYTALTQRSYAQQDDGSWLTTYKQYYMSSGIGPIHWMAPEFFTGHYTEKADIFSLGTLFFAILERDVIVIAGKAIYGAFVDIPGVGKIGLGLAMEEVDRRIRIAFSSYAQGSNALQRVALETLQYNPNDRPSAQEGALKS